MAYVEFHVTKGNVRFECRALSAREALGEVTQIDLELVSPEPVAAKSLLNEPCTVTLASSVSERRVHGIVTRVVALGTAQSSGSRRYEVCVRSAAHLLTLRRQTRVFQHLSIPALIEKVLHDAGFPANHVRLSLAAEHAEREYVVQYAETDFVFVRRLCEEDGLSFRFEAQDGFDAFVLEDALSSEERALSLALVDGSALTSARPAAWDCRELRRQRPGAVTLRDYDPGHPALHLEGDAGGGTDVEKGIEVYAAPGRFRTPSEGSMRARLALESLRAEALSLRFHTNALELAPGLAFAMTPTPDYEGAVRPEDEHRAVALQHRWRAEVPGYAIEVTAVPSTVPYRLPRVTPRPRIAGLHGAVVTGPSGQEIHADAAGHVRVRFFWDQQGATYDKSSLPVRVMQPQLPGSMLLPRVGWEVVVAFEDGDPDRPVILGRAYNAKQLPPFSLPANKTVTSLATASSPGGACQNSVHFDDAAGRQHMAWSAGLAKTTLVANNMMTQTVGNEERGIGGAQSFQIGSNESVSVKDVYLVSVASQTAKVGGSQTIKVLGDMGITSGSESVTIGGMLLEKVGNPVTGLLGLAKAAALEAFGSWKRMPHWAAPVAGLAISAGEAFVKSGGLEGKGADGAEAAAYATGKGVLDYAAARVPGGDAVIAAAEGAEKAPWLPPETENVAKGGVIAGGGAGGASAAAAGPAGPAPGHRVTKVAGVMTELIGGPHAVLSPGPIKWTTLGRSMFVTGGDHNIRASTVSTRTAGASIDTAASSTLTAAGFITRDIGAALVRTVDGAVSLTAGKDVHFDVGGTLALKVGGSLSLQGGNVTFECGGSSISASAGGVLLKATTITINGNVAQDGKATTP